MMMITARLLRWLLLGLFGLFFVTACAPSQTTVPSFALKQRFEQIAQQQQQQAELLKSLQAQLAQLQTQLSQGTAAEKTVQQPTPAVPTAQQPKLSVPQNQPAAELAADAATYLKAFTSLAAGRYAQAEEGFNEFLNRYPQHQYAANARYWLAIAQAAQGDFETAMSNLRRITLDPAGQAKAPAALLQMAQLYRQQQQPIEADDVLEQLRNRYPDSPEAQHFYRSDEPQ